ncbi:MAG: hypothetical protein KF774_06755 [Planctomyces sp.]|nr:hypothetical protein [Planctomyces sp.]
MTFRHPLVVLALALPLVVASSCTKEQPFRKPTTKVVGKVTVDGAAPDPAVQVECVAVGGMDASHPTFSRSDTREDGSFEISTYETGDGVPPGEYVLTFLQQPFNVMSRNYGADKFKGRYADAKKSEHKFTVAEGDPPVDLGTFDLKSK